MATRSDGNQPNNRRGEHWLVVIRFLFASFVAIGLTAATLKQNERLSSADIVVIAVIAGTLAMMAGSFARSPSQFVAAVWQRLLFVLWTPVALFLMIALLLFRVGFLLFKVFFKLAIAAIVGIVYLLFPIDLIPDFILGLGQIDDLLLIVGIAIWAFSAGTMEALKSSIQSRRPTVDFP